ncbi:MAG: cobalamin biosynthesis protein CobW [Pseudomonadota bacterium]
MNSIVQGKIPATIITGFLGAGKTTLIRHILQNAGNRRLALIINEFGDVGVDGEILKACGVENCPEENIIELANGCICCTVSDDFIPAIEALLAHDLKPEHIIIETSGLALPKPLLQAFQWPAIRSRLTVDGVIAVVDGPAVAAGQFVDSPESLARQRALDPSLDHDNPLEEVYEDQLLCADLIVLNKTDLLSEEQSRAVANEINALIPRAVKTILTRQGRIDPDILLGLGAAAEDDLAARPSHIDAEGEHDHEDFQSFVVQIAEITNPDAFVERLQRVVQAHDVLRIKGFAVVRAKPMRLIVQGVGNRFQHHYDRVWGAGEARQGQLVVIGRTGLDRGAITAAILG